MTVSSLVHLFVILNNYGKHANSLRYSTMHHRDPLYAYKCFKANQIVYQNNTHSVTSLIQENRWKERAYFKHAVSPAVKSENGSFQDIKLDVVEEMALLDVFPTVAAVELELECMCGGFLTKLEDDLCVSNVFNAWYACNYKY